MKILWLYINSHYSAFIPVSVSLCEIPNPSQELQQKYDDLKAKFMLRMVNFVNEVRAAAGPMVEKLTEGEDTDLFKGYVSSLLNMPQVQIASKLGA